MKVLRSIMWFVLFVLMVPAIVEASDNSFSASPLTVIIGVVLVSVFVGLSVFLRAWELTIVSFAILVLTFLAFTSFKEYEDLSNQKFTIQGTISDTDINHTGGGLFSREIKETYVKFVDGKGKVFDGINDNIVIGKTYSITYNGHNEITELKEIN